jgi:hypothetical protein
MMAFSRAFMAMSKTDDQWEILDSNELLLLLWLLLLKTKGSFMVLLMYCIMEVGERDRHSNVVVVVVNDDVAG